METDHALFYRVLAHRLALLGAFSLLAVMNGCAPVHYPGTRQEFDASASQEEQVPRPPSVPQAEPQESAPVTLAPPQWIGSRFVLLRKPRIFRMHGYQLYTNQDAARAAAKKQSKEVSSARLSYPEGAGAEVSVREVDLEPDGEYLVTFSLDSVSLFAKTRHKCIEGIVPVHDRAFALKRWKGATVYSRRRLIDTYDSLSGAFSAVKISLRDPLKVIDVEWGFTPLPPKPILLHVVHSSGIRGFIPLQCSWTNVIPEKQSLGIPWEADILEHDPQNMYRWDEVIWRAIDNAEVFTGMSSTQVRFSWGEPIAVRREESKVEFIYAGQKLRFENDTLVVVSAE